MKQPDFMGKCKSGLADHSLFSHIASCDWPAIPTNPGAQALALQFQLEHSQWMSPDEVQSAQFRQLGNVLDEVFRKIEYWNDVLRKINFQPGRLVAGEQFTALPILTRLDVQRLGDSLLNPNVPAQHGRFYKAHTSGSTGIPVAFYQTDLTQHFWRALTLREHFWQQRDFRGSLASIRSNVEIGQAPNWGIATENVIRTGPAYAMNIRTDIGEQLGWLVEKNPDYLLTHPSNLKALVNQAIQRGIVLPNLKQVRTFGEVLTEETRQLSKRAWGVEIADVYSSEEAGYIALQCDHGTYHIQSENLLVEIVDDSGEPTRPGEIGRVLLTTLHNLAMPLIRYDIGDYAESGANCPCGRGLPVIRRILGRERNMLKLPDGTEHWPSFPEDRWVDIAPIQQLQVVQKHLDEVVLKIKSERSLTNDEMFRLVEIFKTTLAFPYRVTIERVTSIPRNKNAKFEDFICEIK